MLHMRYDEGGEIEAVGEGAKLGDTLKHNRDANQSNSQCERSEYHVQPSAHFVCPLGKQERIMDHATTRNANVGNIHIHRSA